MSVIFTDKCCPFQWLDEAVPTLGSHPTEFLQVRDNVIYLVAIEDREEFARNAPAEDFCQTPTALQPGDHVTFAYTESFGTLTYQIEDDGMPTILGTYPDHANCFGSSSQLVIAPSPVEAAREMLEATKEANGEIDAWYWSDGVVYTVCLDADGRPRFELAGALQ